MPFKMEKKFFLLLEKPWYIPRNFQNQCQLCVYVKSGSTPIADLHLSELHDMTELDR